MTHHTVTLTEPQLQALVGLVSAAGSRLGDAHIMLAASDMLRLIQDQISAPPKADTVTALKEAAE